ncbi:MAG: hypothetical protein KC656_28680, partial [Myxococcales bacterium]|nr:hypothetical protein [Myxococcales bacterium]
MAIARSWLRISGLLWEDLTFEPDVGWETDTIAARPPEGEGPWTVSLHDEAGTVLALARPEVRFVDPGGVRAMRRARVVAYLPLRSGARELRLAREHQVLHTQPVSPFRPKVEVSSLEVEDGTVHLAWTALHPDPAAGRLSFRVV